MGQHISGKILGQSVTKKLNHNTPSEIFCLAFEIACLDTKGKGEGKESKS